jgi:hypothetical protein
MVAAVTDEGGWSGFKDASSVCDIGISCEAMDEFVIPVGDRLCKVELEDG